MATSCSNMTTNGCPKNSSNGSCRNRDLCCKEKSEFQQTICDCIEKIDQYKLQKRSLTNQFRKRSVSKCKDFKRMKKTTYQAKIKEIDDKIADKIAIINELKKAKKSAQIVRNADSFCRKGGVCNSC